MTYVYNPPRACRDTTSLWQLLKGNFCKGEAMTKQQVVDSIPGVGMAEAAILVRTLALSLSNYLILRLDLIIIDSICIPGFEERH